MQIQHYFPFFDDFPASFRARGIMTAETFLRQRGEDCSKAKAIVASLDINRQASNNNRAKSRLHR